MVPNQFLYNVFIAIPVEKQNQAMFEKGYQYREDLTELLVDQGGNWIGSGFGCFGDTVAHQAFDIQIAYPDEAGAERAATFAQNWLRNRGYTVSPEKKMQYNGKAYTFWVKFDPNSHTTRKPKPAKVVGKPVPQKPTRRPPNRAHKPKTT